MFDCHVHSSFSFDSDMTADIACETAISKGLDGIAFTDHLDYDFPGFDDEFMIDFDLYDRAMNKLKHQYSSRLKIIKGIEVGIQPHVIERTLNTIKKYDFDYILGSIHIINGKDPYKAGYYTGKTKKEAYEEYLKEIVYMVRNFKNYDCIGHFDYITRCACYNDRSLRYNDFCEYIDELFKLVVGSGKGIEINTGSYRDRNTGMPEVEFDIKILKRYRELGGEIVCVGSDAHSPHHIGHKFSIFRNILLEAGFSHTAYFEERKPVFTRID